CTQSTIKDIMLMCLALGLRHNKVLLILFYHIDFVTQIIMVQSYMIFMMEQNIGNILIIGIFYQILIISLILLIQMVFLQVHLLVRQCGLFILH
ncbi:hypothetical protein ALC57_11208, partial [Trachymyrmex cornetzi]